MGQARAKNRFKETEHLLRYYEYYKAKIEEKKAEIEYISKYGLPEVSPNFVGSVIAGNIDKEDMIEEEITRLNKLVDFMEKSVKLIELAIDAIKLDPYYIIIELRCMKHKSLEYIAEYINASTTTVYRNKERLIKIASNVIFPQDNLQKILPKGGGKSEKG